MKICGNCKCVSIHTTCVTTEPTEIGRPLRWICQICKTDQTTQGQGSGANDDEDKNDSKQNVMDMLREIKKKLKKLDKIEKDTEQINELKSSVDLMSTKYNETIENLKKQDDLIKDVNIEVKELNKIVDKKVCEVEELSVRMQVLEQDSRVLKDEDDSGEPVWVASAGGDVPEGAVCGGSDHDCEIFIARSMHEGDLLPGKFNPSHGVTYVSWAGGEHRKEEYEVLCGCKPKWVQVNQGDEIPANALPGGRTGNGETLFIGRVPHEGTVTVGKVHPSHATCYIPYGGEEVGFREYKVLVRN